MLLSGLRLNVFHSGARSTYARRNGACRCAAAAVGLFAHHEAQLGAVGNFIVCDIVAVTEFAVNVEFVDINVLGAPVVGYHLKVASVAHMHCHCRHGGRTDVIDVTGIKRRYVVYWSVDVTAL